MAAPRLPALVAALGASDAVMTEAAARALAKLAFNEATEVAIAKAGGIAPLVEVVRLGRDSAKKAAVVALRSLSIKDANKVAIAEAGAIAPLIELLRGSSASVKEDAAGALRNLANNDANAAEIAAGGGIAPLEQLVCDGEGDAQRWASEALERVRAAVEAQAAAPQERQAGVDEHMPDPPEDYACPITHEAMIDPVTDALGNTYERAAIEQWLQSHNTSPLTGATLPDNDKRLVPNNVLKSIIQEWERRKQAKSG